MGPCGAFSFRIKSGSSGGARGWALSFASIPVSSALPCGPRQKLTLLFFCSWGSVGHWAPCPGGATFDFPGQGVGRARGGNPGTRRPQRRSRGEGSSRRVSRSAPVTRAPPSGLSPRLAHRVPHVIHPRRRRGNGAAPGNGFLGKERIPDVRDACGEGRKGAKKARRPFTPLPDDVFSDDVRDGRGIYRQRGEVADAQAPGNGFF